MSLALLATLIHSACTAQSHDPFKRPGALKGYELYSWPDTSGGWNFCILHGTNRAKSTGEVFQEKTILRGVDPLKRRLASLAPGSHVFWADRIAGGTGPLTDGSQRLSYPPPGVMDEILAYGRKHRINIQIVANTP